MRTSHALAVLIAAALGLGCTTAHTIARPAFGTTHVTLYDCGLAQIERQADVEGASKLTIDVEQAHLDDLLASLVLATDGTVKVKGVGFPGVQNLGQAVASSGFANSMLDGSGGLEMPADLIGYARALVGTSVVIRDAKGGEMKGTILDAVLPPGQEPDGEGHVAPADPIMVVVTASGALRWVPLSTVSEVAPASQLEASSIKNFAAALGQANGFNETTLVLETTPESKGKLAASYVRQIPVWRTVYKTRVVEGKVILEAWAVVHNDTSEDWIDVSMTLVSGLPSSYVFSVASPRYSHREIVEAPGGEGEMMPQLGAMTPDALLYDWDIYHADSFGYGGLGGGGYGAGYGYGLGSMGTIGHGGGGYGEAASSLLVVGESAAEEGMYAEVEKEISTYTAMSTVTLPSGGTSLVPLIQRELPGEAFTMLSRGDAPSSCVRIENTTGLVLQPGMSSFYIDGRFRGQDDLDRLEPGDVRVLCYGEDMDVEFDTETTVEEAHAALEWRNDALWVHTLRTTTTDYTIENFAGQPRDLAIEITHIANGRVISPKELLTTDLDTRKLHPFPVEPRSKTEKRIVIEEGVMTHVPLDLASFDRILDAGTLPEGYAKALEAGRPVLEDKKKLEAQVAEKEKAIRELDEKVTWQKDLLASVPQTDGKSKAVDTILAEIMDAKKRSATLAKEIEALVEKIAAQELKAKEVLLMKLPAPGSASAAP
jgi:hypothetical protein